MALEKDFELLDDYLANRLRAEDKASFEKQMESDLELKREFIVQQKLVEGIKQARLAELKGILNNTPIPPAPVGQALLAKLGIVAVVAGLVGTGIYFFLNKNNAEVKPEPEVITQEIPSTQKESEPVLESKKEEAKVDEPAASEEIASSKKDKKEGNKVTVPSKSSDKATEVAKPIKPEAFDPTEEMESTEMHNENILKGYARVSNGSSIGIESITDNKKYNFHYQFEEGKLKLYGPTFREKTMYEILEFFVDKKRTTIVLYHENKYYLLKEDADGVTPLKAITDPALLNKLQEYRGN